MDIGDPVPLPARKTRLLFLFVKIGGLPTQVRRVKILKCVDINDCVYMVLDFARDKRNRSTASTNLKLGGLGSKHVLRHGAGPSDGNRKRGIPIGGPNSTVLDAK